MKWLRAHKKELTKAEQDLAVARTKRQQAEQLTEEGRNRWPDVIHIVSESREIRRRNHLAEDIMLIFRSHP
jgi:hypothetical protein